MTESVQRCITKRLRGLCSLSYANRLVLNTDSLELRSLRIDLITIYKIMFSTSFAMYRLNFSCMTMRIVLEVIILD